MLNSAVRSFADPWEFQATVRGSDLEVLVTARGAYRSKLTSIDMHRLRMQRAETYLPQITRATVANDRNTVYFLADWHQAPIHQSGVEMPPGVLVFSAPAAEHHRRMSTASRWGSMGLTPEELAAASYAMIGRELTAPAKTSLVRPPPHLMSRLLNLHEAAGRLAATAPDILAHPEVTRAMEQALLHAMIRCLAEGLAIGNDSAREKRLPVMRRFRQALEENPDRPLYLTEICARIGVSDRTLRLHCQEHLGMSPHRYLWLRRMNFVRRALAVADPSSATVTGIAVDFGFGELGRFAVQYRTLFGESPSATLRACKTMAGR